MRQTGSLVISLAAIVLSASAACAAGDAAKGEQLYNIQCASCHSFDPTQTRAGPSLKGIIGRTAGTAPGFVQFSPALKSSGIIWSEATLAPFLADPQAAVSGTTMLARVADETQRNNIIAYLVAASAK